MITIQKYIRAKSLEEAWELNQNKRNRILGGMLWLRLGKGSVNTAIDLCDLGLNTIEETEEQFSIGAMATLRDIELHESLNAYTGSAIANAVKDIVGVQFRNMATVGGSIWGRFGFSDVLTVFLALDSYVELYKGGIVPLEQFAKMKKDNDILVRLIPGDGICQIPWGQEGAWVGGEGSGSTMGWSPLCARTAGRGQEGAEVCSWEVPCLSSQGVA